MNQSVDLAIGIDVGSVSIKAAILVPSELSDLMAKVQQQCGSIIHTYDNNTFDNYSLFLTTYQRTFGEPKRAVRRLLQHLLEAVGSDACIALKITGIAGKGIASLLNISHTNEFQAIAKSISRLHPEIRTVLEIGADSSKYILLDPNTSTNGDIGIVDYEVNGDCAAGTGSFLDQQATRLLFKVEDIGDMVLEVEKAATIAGRCSVFAKSDMIHAQQKGFLPSQILKGLCESVVRNYKGVITKSKTIEPPVAFIGGVAANKGIEQALRSVFELHDGQMLIPPYHNWVEAIGCALMAKEKLSIIPSIDRVLPLLDDHHTKAAHIQSTRRISTEKLILLRDQIAPYKLPKTGTIRCYLGIDIGSVSTKLVLIDETGQVMKAIYSRTDARPIEVVGKGLQEIEHELGARIEVIGVGTTGSGRELIGGLIGADAIKDEITAHKTGAMFVSETMTGKKVDTIFDIGGQDAKYIAIENGVVVDFTMNEACAAGTGSFLEEQAEKLGIQIKNDFAKLALSSEYPVRLGERCTVFIEKDITQFLQQGASKRDITAGLAFSIVYNYLNRVVRGRRIGNVIYFQGGTAYNDAVAATFTTILNKHVIVPPHNGVIGAIGAALLARDKLNKSDGKTGFRGFSLDHINYSLRSFTCKGCSNFCDIQQFTVEGEKTYWGDKCSEKYRSATKIDRQATIPDLLEYREQLFHGEPQPGTTTMGPVIGYPRSMYFYDQYPFWRTYFEALGIKLQISEPTNKHIIHAGSECRVAEPCFPIEVAHGHVKQLIDHNVDFIFLPNVINMETNFPNVNSYLCPWGQTLCLVVRETPAFHSYRDKILHPNIRFAEGRKQVKRELREMAKLLGRPGRLSDSAVDAAYERRQQFTNKLLVKGREIVTTMTEAGEKGIVVLGRPYNIYDRMINLNVLGKLRDHYGINIIPIDFLATDEIDISDVTDNMFWNFGRKILQVAKFTRDYPNLHLLYITNFKCGPDSYIKHYVRDAARKPFLTLQFDSHGNDAGMMTRCEAFLDSNGFLG
ncbi:hypothetical protein JW960_15430 [candidate division KSB1 bacterium]|nr:hypothetical protein [candidate division KSB1 bacterium]